MHKIVVNKISKRRILGYLILCWLLGLSGKIQASADEKENTDTAVNSKEAKKIDNNDKEDEETTNLVSQEQRNIALKSAAFGALGTLVGYSLWALSVYGRYIVSPEMETVSLRVKRYKKKQVIDEDKSQLKKTVYYSHETAEAGGTIVGALTGLAAGEVVASHSAAAVASAGALTTASAPMVIAGAAVYASIKGIFLVGGTLLGQTVGHDISAYNYPSKTTYISYDAELDRLGEDTNHPDYVRVTYEPIYRYKEIKDEEAYITTETVWRRVPFDFSSLIPDNMKQAGQVGSTIFTALFLAGYKWGDKLFLSPKGK